MAYRIGQDDEEEKKQYTLEESVARRQRIEAESYQKKQTAGAQKAEQTKKIQIDLAQHKPSDIAALGYQMSGEERQNFLDFAQGYYKSVGAQGQMKDSEITAQWDAWDAERESALERNRIATAEKELNSALGTKGNLSGLEALSVIAGMENDGEKKAAQESYAALAGTAGSAYYSPYDKATSAALKVLGVEAVDDAWFSQNAALASDLLRNAYTGAIEKPGNSATESQKKAYAMHVLQENEQTTKDAESELTTLYEEIAADVAAYGEEFDAAEYIADIDWDEYPTLKKMQEGAQTGEYVQLNRAVPLSTEALYGAAYCAQKGITPTDVREYALYAGAWVNELKQQATLGTSEEEPEGIIAGLVDRLSGEKGEREARKEKGQRARDTLDALGIAYDYEAPQEEESIPEAKPETISPDEDGDGANTTAEEAKDTSGSAAQTAPIEGSLAEEAGAQKTTPTGWVSGLKAVGDTAPQGEEKEEADAQETTPTGWMKERTQESRIKAFQGGSYAFVESAQDRNALRRIDAQIALAQQEKRTLEDEKWRNAQSVKYAGKSIEAGEKLTAIDERIGRLNAKKIRIAFGGSGETASSTNVTARRTITPETAQDVSARTQAIAAQREAEEAKTSQNMQPPTGWGTTEYTLWYEASTAGTEAIYDAYEAAKTEAYEMEDTDAQLDALQAAEYELSEGIKRQQVRASVLESLIPEDEETQAIREAAGTERMSLLCEREVASALGDEEKATQITNQLLEAGYAACWPEEEEAVAQERTQAIEYARGWGDETVRARLGITDGRELTEDDYYQAAHTDKGFWQWQMWGIKEGVDNWISLSLKERFFPSQEKQAEMRAEMDAYLQTVEEKGATEALLDAFAQGAVGTDASLEQAETVKNIAAVPLAIEGGMMRAGTSAVQGAADVLEAMMYEAARAQYGSSVTREEAAILSPGYKMAQEAQSAIGTAAETITPDVSGRSGWVQTIGSLTESVTQNVLYAKEGSAVGKVGTVGLRMLGIKDAATLQRAYKAASELTRNMGFGLSGMKSGLAEARAAGLDNEDALLYATLSAGISAGVENLNIDPLTGAAQVMAGMPDGKEAAAKGVRKAVEKFGVTILKSAAGEGAEEIVEDVAQGALQKAMIDPEMAIIGAGGVIDPARAGKAGLMGAAAGAILAGASYSEGNTSASSAGDTTPQGEAESAKQQTVQSEKHGKLRTATVSAYGDADALTVGEVRERLGEAMTPTVEKWLHNQYEKGAENGRKVSREALEAFIEQDAALEAENAETKAAFERELSGKTLAVHQPKAIEESQKRRDDEKLLPYIRRVLFGGKSDTTVTNAETGIDVIIGKDSVKESQSKATAQGVPGKVIQTALENAGEMLSDAAYIGTQPEYTGKGQGTHFFVSAMQTEEKNYRVVFQVIENADRLQQKNTPHALYLERVDVLDENEMPSTDGSYTHLRVRSRQPTEAASGLPETAQQVGTHGTPAENPSGDVSIAQGGADVNEKEMPSAPGGYTHPSTLQRQDTEVQLDSRNGTTAGNVLTTAEEPSGDASIAQGAGNVNIAMNDLLAGYDREHIKRYDLWKSTAQEDTSHQGEAGGEANENARSDEEMAEIAAQESVEEIRLALIQQDMSAASIAYGSQYTSEKTKAMAEAAIEELMRTNRPLSTRTRTALWQSSARDAAKAQASMPVQEARTELGKAQRDAKAIRAEYGQMNGRLNALKDNATAIVNQMLGGAVTKELQGQYETTLNKLNSLQKRIENQKERMQEAQERVRKAQGALTAAQTQAEADEKTLYAQMMTGNTAASSAGDTSPQGEEKGAGSTAAAGGAQVTPEQAEADVDRQTARALANGDEAGAMALQKAKAQVKITITNAGEQSAIPAALWAEGQTQPQPKRAVREVVDRYADYDVRGLKKYLKDTKIYVNDQQAAEIKNYTGMHIGRAGYKYGVHFTSKREGAIPLDGAAWADISGYMPGILDEKSEHPVNDLLETLDSIWKNEQEKRAGGTLRYMSQRKREKRAGTQDAQTPTQSGQRIIEKLQKAFPGTTVRARSPVGVIDDTGGYADVQTGGTRVVGLQNVEDFVHEIGHLLAAKDGGINQISRSGKGRIEKDGVRVKSEHAAGVDAMVEKLESMKPGELDQYKDAETRRQEAISEFWTIWLEGDEAAKTYAGEAIFDILTGTADEKQMKALKEARTAYQILRGATQAKQDEAQIVSERTARERALEAAATRGLSARLITEVFDENYAAKLIDQTSLASATSGLSREEMKERRRAAKKTGELMMEENDRIYYRQANLSKAAGVAKIWVKNKIIGKKGQVLLDTSIAQVVAPIQKDERKAYGRYVALKNELDARNLQEMRKAAAAEQGRAYIPGAGDYYNLSWAEKDTAWVESEIAQMDAQKPHFKDVHAGMRQIWNALMEEYQIKPGYIENAEEAWKKVNETRPNYLPTHAVENRTVREEGRTQSIAKEKRELRRAMAGDRDLIDPIETFVAELTRMAQQSAKMEVKNTIARVYDEYEGQGQFFREIGKDEMNASGAIFRAIEKKGTFNLTDVDAKTAQAIADQGTETSERRVIVAIENGRARYFEVLDQAVYDMLARTETPQETSREMRALMGVVRTVNNFFRGTTTVLNPFFGVKNMVRDLSTGMVFGTQKNAARFFGTYMKSLAQSAKYYYAGRMDSSEIRQFAAMGGLEGDAYGHDVAQEREKLQDLYGDEMGRLRKMANAMKGAVENFNDTIETGMRFAQFQMGLKAGQSVQRAFRMSQEVTTDFSRTGRTAKKAAKYFYFFNASLQGTYDVMNAIGEKKMDPQRASRLLTRSVIHAAALPLAWSLWRMLRWSDEDKEKYDAAAENVKRENYILGFIGTKAILLPKGQSMIFTIGDALGRTWAEGIEREVRRGGNAMDYIRHEGLEDIMELAGDLIEDINPMQTSVFQTGIDLAFNRNHWGDEITPEYMKGWSARNQWDNYTSTIAKAIGQVTGVFGVSPKMIHYMIDQQAGFVGDLILKMTTPSSGYGQTWEESESVGDFLLSNMSGGLELLLDMTTKGFTSDIATVSSVRDDFAQYGEFFAATISEYEKHDGDRDAMSGKISKSISQKEYARAYNDAEEMNKYLTRAEKAITALYKTMRENPEETKACQDAIMLIQLESNQVAESWQRRYMDGDMSVRVKIPKGDW